MERKCNEGKIINLGAGALVIGDKFFATCENISVSVNDATDEEIFKLQNSLTITLLPVWGKKKVKQRSEGE